MAQALPTSTTSYLAKFGINGSMLAPLVSCPRHRRTTCGCPSQSIAQQAARP